MATLDDLESSIENWDDLFPAINNAPAANTFELGLVLGGTVSAGAYTAGVIDFLVEALDAWQDQKPDADSPTWKVKLKVATGTSGGGVTSVLLARALSYQFPPVRTTSTVDEQNLNPFYRVWVKELDIQKMLATDDLDNTTAIPSLLNASALDNCKQLIANYAVTFQNPVAKARSYVDNPWPVYVTLTNLRGIPYSIDMGINGLVQEYVDHADFVRLAVFSQGLDAHYSLRPDELGVSDQPTLGQIPWSKAMEYALGTAAFPVGFPLRPLDKPVSHYRYRPFIVDDPLNPVKQGTVKWQALLAPGSDTIVNDEYHFLAADGGMADNEPINLCRQVLEGYAPANISSGTDANRALLLIDPFADQASLGPDGALDVIKSLQPLIATLLDQARYDSRDLYLAGNPNIFNRFMITANRQGQVPGGKNIASASLSAFGGFLHEDYRRHDFLLGRQNCQKFLRENFCVHADNPLVKPWVNGRQPGDHPLIFTGADGVASVKLIPLYGNTIYNEATIAFPTGRFGTPPALPPAIEALLQARIAKLVDKIKDNYLNANIFEDIYLLPLLKTGEDQLLASVNSLISQGLSDWGL